MIFLSQNKQEKLEKKNVTLSLPIEAIDLLDNLSVQYGMTKSGLVNILLQKAEKEGIFS